MAEKLRREVEPPQRHQTGLGVMLIASAAMFFAVAGSAFILRARMADSCCPRSHGAHERTTVTIESPRETTPSSRSNDCGRAVYREGADGTTSVTYDLCPPERSAAGGQAPPAVYVVSPPETAE